ncbi:MAG TPA: AsmA family protein [Candidatus Sulfotelmatobacter sp.]|jgi:hypothetical protein|nr:AsmA family protein [Candidatus Sulfotelmatobacter sp.]
MAVASAFILLALFALRPGASSLKSRIIASMSSALGRSVDIGAVHLRLLPRPGFDLENLVVYDDPAFGAEPMLRAGEVTAALRLTSLLRGRLEIARLDLTEPSLNLVHADNGRWNLEALLERAAHTPLAPTGKGKSEPRPGFPYIEGTSARINFKSGQEKKPFALTNADFSLWQDSENSWGARLKAQPFRTDLNLNDTGLLQLSGTWQRAESLRDTPLQLTVEWNRAQLGQFTKFFTGDDQGWRGEVVLDSTLTGTPAHLQIASDASIQDFRRYDITSGEALRLKAHCDSEYSSLDHLFHQILCSSPVAGGLITLKGNSGLPRSHNYELAISVENVPASAVAILARRAKSNLPDDLVADGTVSGGLRIARHAETASKLEFDGRGEIANFRLASDGNRADFATGTLPFLLTASNSAARGQTAHNNASAARFLEGPRIEVGPFALASGRGLANATVRGWFSRSGYGISVAGETAIPKALRLARMVGLPAMQFAGTEGTAQLDLQIAGTWAATGTSAGSSFSAPRVTGAAKLYNVPIPLRGIGPAEIVSADVQLLRDEVRVTRLNVNAAGAAWMGWLSMPRGCSSPGVCQVHFALNANQLDLSDLREWVSPSMASKPWYLVLKPNALSSSFLVNVRASGLVSANHFRLQDLEATNLSARLSLDSGKLQLSQVIGDLLGGHHRGEWQADFRVKPAICEGSGNITAVSLEEVADAMNDDWIAGTANASYALEGPCPADFWNSAKGTMQFEMKDGSLPHVFLADEAEPLKVTIFSGKAKLDSGAIELKDARLNSPAGVFQLTGSASLKGELDLKLARVPNGATATGYTVTGTLAVPRVAQLPSPQTQANLKP